MSRRTTTQKKKKNDGRSKLSLKRPPSSWQPTLKHYFGGKPELVQPTISHFIKKSQPVLKPKQEASTTVPNSPHLSQVEEKTEPADAMVVHNGPQSKVTNTTPDLEQITENGSEVSSRDRAPCGNPFSKNISSVRQTGVATNDVIANEGFSLKPRQKQLSLKARKRKHRTLSVSPPTQNMDGGSVAKKPCRVFKSENVEPKQNVHRLVCKSEPQDLVKVEGHTTVKVSNTSNVSCKLSTEEKALMESYTADSDQSNARTLSLGDLDIDGRHSPVDSPIRSDTPTAHHHKVQSVKSSSTSLVTIPSTPGFSPRHTTPKAFSPFLERTRQSLHTDRREERSRCLVNGHEDKVDTTAVLFSSPVEAVSLRPLSKSAPKRALDFGSVKGVERSTGASSVHAEALPPSKANHSLTGNCPSTMSENDFSFMSDISLSEFADISCIESEQSDAVSLPSSKRQVGINRHLVLEVTSQECSDEGALLSTGRRKSELLLRLLEQKTKVENICYLRDDWLNLDISPGDVIQVNADYDRDTGSFVVDNSCEESSIVVHPDILISGTSVANSVTCARRAVLAEKFKSFSGENEAMIIGRMLHEVFQRVLVTKQEVGVSLVGVALRDTIKKEIQSVVSEVESLDQLYCLGMSETAAATILSEYVPAIMEWCITYLKEEPVLGSGEIEFKRPGESSGKSCVAVTDVLDIEENIWSPRFGLKGKVDVTVNVRERRGMSGDCVSSKRVPLELKTGKMHRKQGTIEHRAQLTLYSLMLGDRYVTPPPGGLLFYLKGGHMQGLAALPHEKRGLLIARNHLARYHGNHDHMTLPGMLRESHTCKYCPHLKQCALYHKAVEHGSESSSGLGELFSKQIDHIPDKHLQFFSKWCHLLSEEEHCCKERDGPPFWLTTAAEREREGTCLSNMAARSSVADMTSGGKRFIQSFSKSPPTASMATAISMATAADTLLTVHDRVVISHQDGSSWAVAIGTILSLTCSDSEREARLLLDKALPSETGVLYRIDRAPAFSRGSVSSSLAELCSSDSERDQHLRELVIDLAAPRFKQLSASSTHPLPPNLNSSQKEALIKVLSARDYTLILGMPGTGKTTTIARLVEVLVSQRKSVLLTSYTHSAVDNILLKLKQSGVDFLRLGSTLRVHPAIQPYTPAHVCTGLSTVQSIEDVYNSKPVVATTCLGVNHPIFTRRSFDVCIVDEASQITLPASLGPLRHASMFVLVGDHYQLPPLVQSQQARDGGLDVSLFRYLSEHHPNALVSLREQYRMNREIMSLSNTLIYNKRLICGNEEVASGRLSLPLLPPPLAPPTSCSGVDVGWTDRAVDPDRPVVFLNTDRCSDAMETIIGDHICNEFEACVVRELVTTLIKYGLKAEEVGVITPLRQQQNLIREKLHDRHSPLNLTSVEGMELRGEEGYNNSDGGGSGGAGVSSCLVEVNTVDKYQGRDKECIIVSCTRSNPKGNTGALLRDWRRINVALTRAKHKLILIGSSNTLSHAPLLKSLIDILSSNQWIVDIPTTTRFT